MPKKLRTRLWMFGLFSLASINGYLGYKFGPIVIIWSMISGSVYGWAAAANLRGRY